jgi:hypothetical protein
MTPPVELGKSLSPQYRVAPTIRYQGAHKQLSEQPTIRAVAPRRPAGETKKKRAGVDLSCKLQIAELCYPGAVGNRERVDDKWAYVFDLYGGKCLVEAHGKIAESGGVKAQRWSYRVAASGGKIEPGDLSKKPELPLSSSNRIELKLEDLSPGTKLAVFLTPIRLSKQGLEFLLKHTDTDPERDDKSCPLTKARWTSTSVVTAWVPDPWRWAEDAFWEFEFQRLERLLGWHQDEATQARLFIAKTLKSLQKGGVSQFSNNLRSGQPDSFLKKTKREHEKLQKAAEEAAAYVCQCLDAPEHRAIELSAHERGGQAVSDALQHWAVACMGKKLTTTGREFLRLVAKHRTDSTPMKYIFTPSPPANGPNLAEARYGLIAARQVAADLMEAVFAIEMEKVKSKAPEDWQKALDGLQSQVERIYKTAKNRSGKANTRWKRKRIVRAIRHGKQEMKLGKKFSKLVLDSGLDMPRSPDEVIASTSKDSRWRGWSDRLPKLKKAILPIAALAEIWNLCSGFAAWQSATAKDPKVELFGGAELSTSAVGAIGASTDFAGFMVETAAIFKKIGEKGAARIAGPLAIVSGASEMLTHGHNALDASYGRNNMASATASGVAAFGGAMGAVGGAMALAWSFGATSAMFGHVGLVVGVVGGVLVFLGAFVASYLKRDAYEHFAEHCFLGDSTGEDSGRDHPWSPYRPLPTGDDAASLKKQVIVLTHILAAFQVKVDSTDKSNASKSGTSGNPIYDWGRDQKFDAEIVMGYTPPGGILEVEAEMLFGWVTNGGTMKKFTAKLRVADSTTNIDLDTDSSTMVLLTPAVERTADGRLKRVPIALRPSALKVGPNKWVTMDDTTRKSLQYVIVRARLSQHGTTDSAGLRVPPDGKWCEVQLHGPKPTKAGHTLDGAFIK